MQRSMRRCQRPFHESNRQQGFRRERQHPHLRRVVARAAAIDADVSEGVVIAGAGLAGLGVAAALRKVGIPYLVLEQRGELSQEGAAIALWGNAMKALEQIGIADAIRSEHLELDTVRICRDSGAVLKEFSFADCAGGVPELIGVSRERLQQLLYQAADPERVALDATVASVDVRGSDGGAPVVTLESGREIACRVAVGADGVRSAVARSVGAPSTSFVGQAGYRGIAEFDGTPPVAARTVCQIFGVGVRAGMYPMAGNTVYWFVCFDDDGTPVSSTADEKKASALAMVRGWHHGIVECIQNTRAERISRNRFFDRISPGTLATRIGAAHVTLAGDSLHPMTPNLGQGGCVALEDGIVLAQELARVWQNKGADVGAALGAYEKARAKRCLPLTARGRAMGAVLQSSLPPLVLARDTAVSKFLDPGHFFDHTLFDVGAL